MRLKMPHLKDVGVLSIGIYGNYSYPREYMNLVSPSQDIIANKTLNAFSI